MKDKSTPETREVDLLELITHLFRFVKNAIKTFSLALMKVFLYLLYFGIKKWIFIGVFILVGAGVGTLKYFTSENYYSSDLVLRSNEVDNEEIIQILSKLSIYAGITNPDPLAKAMGVSSDVASKIVSLGAYWFIDMDFDGVSDYVDFKNEFNQLEDTTLRRIQGVVNVRVLVTDPLVLEDVEAGLLYYINHNDLLVRLNQSRISSLKNHIESLDKELIVLDSLQKYEYFEKDKRADIDLGSIGKLRIQGEEKDTRLLHDDILELEARKLEYEKELAVYGDITSVMSGFASTYRTEKSFIFSLVYNGFLWGGIAYIILFVFCNKQSVIAFLKENTKL